MKLFFYVMINTLVCFLNFGFSSMKGVGRSPMKDELSDKEKIVNRIKNTEKKAKKQTSVVSPLPEGAKVNPLLNPSTGDLLKDARDKASIKATIADAALKLKELWNKFVKSDGPGVKIAQLSNEDGDIQITIALKNSTKEMQNRITVLAINPLELVPKELCFRSYNYTSRYDPDNIHYEFSSPTFKRVIQDHSEEPKEEQDKSK